MITISNKFCSFELFIHQRIMKQNVSLFQQTYKAVQLFSTFIIIRNVSWAPNQHFRKIAEGSYDPKDWRPEE